EVDDGAAFPAVLGRHALHRLAGAEKRARDVDVEDPANRGGIVALEASGVSGDAGVVDERRQRAELPVDDVEDPEHVVLVRDVALNEGDAAALDADLVGEPARAILAGDVVDADGIAATGGKPRRRCSDAA